MVSQFCTHLLSTKENTGQKGNAHVKISNQYNKEGAPKYIIDTIVN